MSLVKMKVDRMTTSRSGETKYEHFTMLVNDQGKEMSLFMRHDPMEALYQTMEMAKFLGVPCDPLIIDGKTVELTPFFQSMLED